MNLDINYMKKGEKMSEEQKKKISKSLKQIELKPWLGANKGRKFSDEIKTNMSNGKKKFYADGGRHPLKGTHRSKETKEKIREKLKGTTVSIEKRLKRSSTLPSGDKHYNWKGGVNPINDTIRHGIEFNLWRESVFARDNWTCKKTGIKGGVLHAHHIKNFAQYPELRFAIDNGVTLSEKAHKEFHKKYGTKNNTKEQLKEFLQ